jgi:RHH-type proline utilization regulon transcriptional repressor/proline dehydrogenase/delta 1-pyrroline-5-carboxylate dehydrogenase
MSLISSAKFLDEAELVEKLLDSAPYDSATAAAIREDAILAVESSRLDSSTKPLLDTFLTEYGLSNKEGVVFMCLAESLLRIPDQRTAERLIADKIQLGNWATHAGQADSLLVNASTWALMLTGRLVAADQDFTSRPESWFEQLASRVSEPVIEKAMRGAMQTLGREFVLGTTIDRALNNSRENHLYSYDMLGEAARDLSTANRYFESYKHAIQTIGQRSVFNPLGRPQVRPCSAIAKGVNAFAEKGKINSQS